MLRGVLELSRCRLRNSYFEPKELTFNIHIFVSATAFKNSC